MNLTITGIIAVVTYLMGQITKKLGWVNKKYIPIQNIVIGLISGVLCWLVDLEPDIVKAIIACIITCLGTGGAYDLATINHSEVELEYDTEMGDDN
jgi:hypothetical protein